MDDRDFYAIELDKILATATELLVCRPNRRRMEQLRPATDRQAVLLALEETDGFASMLLRRETPRYADGEGAPEAVSRAAKGGVLSMGELLAVAGVLHSFQNLFNWFSQDEKMPDALRPLFYPISPDAALEHSIKDAILSPEEMADTASSELNDIRRKIRNLESSIREKLDSLIRGQQYQKFLQEPIVTFRQGRFVVPVKAEFRSEVAGVTHDVSASGSTFFVEPAAVAEAGAAIMQWRNREEAEMQRILEAFSQQVAGLSPQFAASYNAMLDIDFVLAKAKLALRHKAYKPAVEQHFRFSLKKARHPLIPAAQAVPVDIALGFGYDTLIITGPNTGGKTVALKTAGLLCAMAACGFLIPAAENSSVAVFQDILADIGDEQSIEQSLSTFSGHMRNIIAILEQAGPASLVLIDELGAGTDPAEGAALAVAIVEKLRQKGAKILATTHYGELKIFALETEGVENGSTEFDLESLRPTYKLKVGAPGRSNAFLIGQKLGLPSQVVQMAQAHLSAEDARFESVLARLDDLQKQLEESKKESEQLRFAADHALASAEAERDKRIAEGEKALQEARREAKALIEKVQNESFKLYDEMQQLKKQEDKDTREKAIRLRQIARKDSEGLFDIVGGEEQGRSYAPLAEVQVGQQVAVGDLRVSAKVLALPDKNGNVEILQGNLRTRVPLSDLHAWRDAPAPKTRTVRETSQSRVAAASAAGPRTSRTELNLLGKNVEEAILDIDTFLDQALRDGLHEVYLIHGRGTGALRAGVQQHLRRHPAAASYRLGKYGEGEDGVTVVQLK